MRVLVCGSRSWDDVQYIFLQIRRLSREHDELVVIEGEAPGADTIAKHCADLLSLPVEKYPALWRVYGKKAGPIRNQQMLDEGKPDLVLAFHDDLVHSSGTADMVDKAKKAGVPVEVYSHETQGVT